MKIALTVAALIAATVAAAFADEEDVRVRGDLPHMLAQGETSVQLAQRIAQTIGVLDRRIAPPCGMQRIFEIAGAEHFDMNDMTKRVDPNKPGVWRISVYGKGCWATRLHNVYLFPRGSSPAELRAGVPGRTLASVKYQQSATQLVLRQANGIAQRLNCGSPAFLTDSQLEGPKVPGKAWREKWSAQACGITRTFDVTFTPDGTKMRIMAVLAD
ncbi:MAG: hypothetical protein GC190_05115 [Alphaproteobacteria bacterium]|nr:hypothetical protein [Alphaproteobacteria bacterium]